MESKIFHGDSSIVETQLNAFMKQGNISIKNIEMSTCAQGTAVSRTMVTVLVLFERR